MNDHGFFQLVASNVRDLTPRLVNAALIFALFAVGAFAYELARQRLRHGKTERFAATLRFVFRSDLYRHATSRADRWNFLFVYLFWLPVIVSLLTVAATLTSASFFANELNMAFGRRVTLLHSHTAVVAFEVSALFLSAEFGAYIAHRMLHRVPLLWSLHRVHHSAEALTFFTRLRDHPLDLLFFIPSRIVSAGLGGGICLFVTGTSLDPTAMSLTASIGIAIPFGFDLWRHCHIPISLGPLNYVLNAPVMHQIHHSAEIRHRDKNLGSELMLFDWLFGTLYVPKAGEQYRWGLNDRELGNSNPHNSLRGFYFEPFAYALRLLRNKPQH